MRPESFSKEVWERAIKIYDSRSSVYDKVRSHSKAMFIGGALENCVANAMGYFQDEFGFAGQDMCYVPELCVSVDRVELVVIEAKIKKRGVKSLSVEQAIRLIHE